MRYYERKEYIWIGNQYDKRDIDICIKDIPLEIFVDNNMIILKKDTLDNIYLNNAQVTDDKFLIEIGDILSFDEIIITFFENYIEVEGDDTGDLPQTGNNTGDSTQTGDEANETP